MRFHKNILTLCCLSLMSLSQPAWARHQGWELATLALQVTSGGPALVSLLQHQHSSDAQPEFLHQVLKNAAAMEAKGLPTKLYLLKAEEGLSKNISPTKLTRSLKQTRQKTRQAASLLNPVAKQLKFRKNTKQYNQMVQSYQWALRRGVPAKHLRRISQQWGYQNLTQDKIQQWQRELKQLPMEGIGQMKPKQGPIVQPPAAQKKSKASHHHKKKHNNYMKLKTVPTKKSIRKGKKAAEKPHENHNRNHNRGKKK